MRKKIFGANWKMNYSKTEANTYFNEIKELLKNMPSLFKENEIIFFPPMQLLVYLQDIYGPDFNIGSQNFYYMPQGAFTGEVSFDMLLMDHIQYTLVGHSERRQFFNEKNDSINLKVKKALEHNIKVILCIGESLTIRENGKEKEFITEQITFALKNINPEKSPFLILAYEPIWAIGTGKSATIEQITQMHQHIRETLNLLKFNGENIRIIYGGSVKTDSINRIMSISDVDGVLVGSASLKAKEFFNIVNY